MKNACKPHWILLYALVAACLHASPPPGTFQLEFEELFNGSTLDGTKWKVGQADAGIAGQAGNVPDNITVSGGSLSIKATNSPSVFCGKSFSYSAGEISTFYKFRQKYGYMEARMKWDTETGMWPAFWLMPDRGTYGYEPWFVNTFMKFDLSSAGIGSVSSATLRLRVISVSNTTSNNLQTFKVSDDSWSESTITWDNQPVWDPLFIDQKWNTTANTGDFIEIDVTDYVGDEVAGDGVVSLALSDAFRRARQMLFHSREATNVADRPQLVVNGVTYYPTADALVRWGSGFQNVNYGSLDEIEVRTGYANTATTQNGGMEVDIMESLGIWGQNETSHALHWDGYGAQQQSSGWPNVPVTDTSVYHDYGVYWEDGLIEFYVDGVKTGTFTDARVMNVSAYAILSLQLGGWDGNNPTSAVNNKSVEIDHVRIWSGTKSGSVPTSTSINPDGSVVLGSDYSAYDAQGIAGSGVSITDSGDGLSISGNGWAKFPINHTVAADTVLEFTVNSNYAGEILAIGYDEDNDIANAKRLFQLAGSDVWTNAWQDSNDYPVGTGPVTYSIHVGDYYTGPMSYLAIAGDDDASSKIYVSLSDIKFTTGGSGGSGSPINIGALNSGVAAVDGRTGTGYLMYSAANVITRFGAYTGNADHVIAVYYNGSQWYADTNFGQVAFTPAATDVLLASVDFTNDTVTSLEGSSGTEYGIDYGYASGDLVYTADFWAGAANDGEFGVTGTTFTPNSSGSAVNVGALNNGVAADDSRTGTGYLMYSASNVVTRFSAQAGNADHIIAVFYSGGQWYADKNFGQVAFTPVSTDTLLASVNFTSDTVSSLEGTSGTVNGITSGYSSGDLVYTADFWAGASNDGEFGVTGTTFTP